MSDRLSPKQQKFADEYIICLNGTEAARRAKYSGNDATLAATASRLLRNDKVLAYIKVNLDTYAMSAAEVLTRLTDIARGDLADALNTMGGVDPLEAARRGKSHLIKRFKTKTTYFGGDDGGESHEEEIEMYDSLKALEMLAKYHDLTNKVRVEDWRNQAIEDIKAGRILYDPLADEFGDDLATQLFAAAGRLIEARTSAEE